MRIVTFYIDLEILFTHCENCCHNKKKAKQALCAKLVEFVEWTPRSQNLTFFARLLRLVF